MKLATAAAVVLLAAGCSAPTVQVPVHPPSRTAVIATLLAKVRTVPARPHPGGYDRVCTTGHGCVFGQPWTDRHNGTGGHNRCDTRDDVLAKQLVRPVLKPGSRCVVISGVLDDPYTGRKITWAKASASIVQIDHVYPLALAWDMGADKWVPQRRIDFANDQDVNLLAVDGHANQAKGDSGPGDWLPINKGYRCTYVAGFLRVAIAYDLPITVADADSIRHTAQGC
jgi:hypothetical protein